MPDDIIGMEDMDEIFTVTDNFGIHRERVSVALEKADPGSVSAVKGGNIEIVVPKTQPVREFAEELWRQLEDLGYQAPD